jgi:spore coat polysaccharide biosynthesis protein SpsF (cytidylyltransferase family)
VTPYIYKHPELFRLNNVFNQEDLSHLRWTVDEAADLEFVRALYARLPVDFRMQDVVSLLQAEPELTQMNIGIGRNEGYIKSLLEDDRL